MHYLREVIQLKFNKQSIIFMTIIMMLAAVLAGCGNSNSGKQSQESNAPSPSTTPSAPIEEPVEPLELSYWVEMPANTVMSLQNYNESLFYQELEKRTNVKVTFQHPAAGSAAEQFNLMVASGRYPDVIEYGWNSYPGGPEKAISDKVIIPVNDLIENHAPNLKAYLEANPEIAKALTTDAGNMYVFPSVGMVSNSNRGMVLRADWLEELGLQPPETIDEWTHVLQEFKDKKGATSPLTFALNDLNPDHFNGAYGISLKYFQEDGVVKFGAYEPVYKDYLAQMKAWYDEGLIDKDFATQDGNSRDAKITGGAAGASIGFVSGGMGGWLSAMEKDPKYDLVAAQHPVLNKGDEPYFFHATSPFRSTGAAAITTSNKNPERTAEWLDYLYSEEGHILKTFGVEGTTYEVDASGKYSYTDLILKNPDGLNVNQAQSKYTRVTAAGPGFVADPRAEISGRPQLTHASGVYSKYVDNWRQRVMPQISETPDEAQEIASIMAEVETYRKEMFLKFVMGAEPLDKFENYLAQLKKMGIERAIEIKQAALDRYNVR